MRSLHYLTGRTRSPFPTEPEHNTLKFVVVLARRAPSDCRPVPISQHLKSDRLRKAHGLCLTVGPLHLGRASYAPATNRCGLSNTVWNLGAGVLVFFLMTSMFRR
jgi:hypothetical protein